MSNEKLTSAANKQFHLVASTVSTSHFRNSDRNYLLSNFQRVTPFNFILLAFSETTRERKSEFPFPRIFHLILLLWVVVKETTYNL